MMRRRRLGAALALCAVATAQQGDQPGEVQAELPSGLRLPAPKPLSPDEERATFQLAAGYEMELVAAEPLVQAPVALAFAADGRVFVVEMRGYMRDVDARDEHAPSGRIVTLHDDDQDGRMDRSEPFLEQLVLPRGVLPLQGGALVIEPPALWFCPDRDGDGRADEKIELAGGFDEGLVNPEHCGNGLLWGIDNWIHLARHPVAFRRRGDTFEQRPEFGGGQWGLAQDDFGRLYYNYNSDALRADLLPSHYFRRDPRQPHGPALNVRLLDDQRVWPIGPTPGVNRGYRSGQLREGRLATFTAACGAAVLRDASAAWDGQVFVCEPSGNLLRRLQLDTGGDRPRAANADGGTEFLTSGDERFRPVNVYAGPDGALWVVDMYRGVIQHRNFVTSWLRRQIVDRRLEQPIDRGRIWRIRPTGAPRTPLLDLRRESGAQLVARLRDPIGARRDLAQGLLVERGDVRVAESLWRLAMDRDAAPPSRLQALWTLEGLGQLHAERLAPLLEEHSPELRAAIWRLGEPWLRELWPQPVGTALAEPDPWVRCQYVLSAGTVLGRDALRQIAAMLAVHRAEPKLRSAARAAVALRELEFLELLLGHPDWHHDDPGTLATLRELTGVLARRRDLAGIERILAWSDRDPRGEQLLQGMLDALPAGDARRGSLRLPRAPRGLEALLAAAEPRIRAQAGKLLEALHWPGRAETALRVLDETEAAAFQRGRGLFAVHCAICHQPDAGGRPGLAPPLAGSAWLRRTPSVLARIVLHGLRGPIDAGGESWDLEMPGQPQLTDAEIAAVLTFVCVEHGNAAPVAEQHVRTVREATHGRSEPWTAAELEAQK